MMGLVALLMVFGGLICCVICCGILLYGAIGYVIATIKLELCVRGIRRRRALLMSKVVAPCA